MLDKCNTMMLSYLSIQHLTISRLYQVAQNTSAWRSQTCSTRTWPWLQVLLASRTCPSPGWVVLPLSVNWQWYTNVMLCSVVGHAACQEPCNTAPGQACVVLLWHGQAFVWPWSHVLSLQSAHQLTRHLSAKCRTNSSALLRLWSSFVLSLPLSMLSPRYRHPKRWYTSVWQHMCCRYGRVDFTWLETGSIQVVTRVQALPFVSLRFGISSNKISFAAFLVLVLLTAAQAALVGLSVWERITGATSWWRVVQVRHARHSPVVGTAWLCLNA